MRKIHLLLSLVFISACTWENLNQLAPESDRLCDTTSVSFLKDIRPILERRCFACHEGFGDPVYEYTDFGAFRAMALNGKLLPAINQTSLRPMPKGKEKIPACEIAKITSWVKAGAKND